ncbi:MAG: DNA polymerase I [Thermaerobacter sp.]|nr:DNA polymerase I [Thermaerobacter sp.]
MADRLLAIDGMSLLNRAYHALPPLTAADGTPTGAVYGFLLTFFKWYEAYRPTHVAIAFDRPGGTFRHAQFERYKAHRKEPDPDLVRQFPLAEEVFSAMGLKVIGVPGFEADDVLGTLAARFQKDIPVTVISGDRDLLQLVGGDCEIVLMRALDRTKRYDPAEVQADFGISPAQVPDWKGLMGDASDGIPGVPGIGEKTAVRLLQIAPTLEQLFEDLDRVTPPRIRDLLLTHREQAAFSKQLATIACDVDFGVELDGLAWSPSTVSPAARARMQELGFRGLLARLPQEEVAAVAIPQAPALEEVYDGGDRVAIAFVDDGVALSDGPGRAISVPWDDARVLEALQGGTVLVHGLKRLLHALERHGLPRPGSAFDTQIAGYLVNPQFGMHEATELLAALFQEAAGEAEAAPARAAATFRLAQLLPEELARHGLAALYEEIEAPLVPVLYAMERQGVRVDRQALTNYGNDLRFAIERIQAEVHALAGYEFNLNSTPQLRDLLFGKLQLPVLKKTKTGPSTDAEVLEQLAAKHPVVQMILDHRQMVKLIGTYVDGLLPLVDEETSRIHTTFQQTLTATGRLSSADPNLQNIPVRFELGRQVRRAFTPSSPEMVFLAADYSQIELRILAHLSGDETLIDAFVQGEDVHRRTAAEVFSVPLAEVTSDQRRQAKAVNFGIVYGISDFGLARDTGVSRPEAAEFIRRYFARYARVKEYLDKAVEQAKELGYVTTMFGRRRYLPDIRSRNHQQRSFAERTAMNTPIQGTAADLIKRAMVRIAGEDATLPAGTHLLLQVHDELIFEVPRTLVRDLAPIVRSGMEGAAQMRVPLQVDLKSGANWYDVEALSDA